MNTKMKVLSLALVGLCGYAGSALAVCPTDPVQPIGAWSAKTVTASTLAIVTPGLDSSACKLSVSVNTGAAANAKAFVTDNSPANEPRYRARFYIDTTALAGLTLANQQTKVFQAVATTAPGTFSTEEVVVRILGGITPSFRFAVADSTQASGFQTISAAFPNAGGLYRVEFDLNSAAGTFRYWISDASAATTDTTPTGSVNATSSGWSGVKSANLGISAMTAGYRTSTAGQALAVDQFDSRRSTFIGQ